MWRRATSSPSWSSCTRERWTWPRRSCPPSCAPPSPSRSADWPTTRKRTSPRRRSSTSIPSLLSKRTAGPPTRPRVAPRSALPVRSHLVKTLRQMVLPHNTIHAVFELVVFVEAHSSPPPKRPCKSDAELPRLRQIKEESMSVNPFAMQQQERSQLDKASIQPKEELPDYLTDGDEDDHLDNMPNFYTSNDVTELPGELRQLVIRDLSFLNLTCRRHGDYSASNELQQGFESGWTVSRCVPNKIVENKWKLNQLWWWLDVAQFNSHFKKKKLFASPDQKRLCNFNNKPKRNKQCIK